MIQPTFPIDFNAIRIALAQEIMKVTQLDQNHVIYEQPETQNFPRPTKPYMSFLITGPANKTGDDTKSQLLDKDGKPTTVWNSGGVRKMTISFNVYGNTHEEAYNYMGLWQTALDLENIQEDLRRVGIAVWIIGNLADLSQLLLTGYEGRAHLECTFGIAMNLTSDLGEMDTVPVNGKVTTDQNEVVETSQQIIKP